jgi:hypothetical protein
MARVGQPGRAAATVHPGAMHPAGRGPVSANKNLFAEGQNRSELLRIGQNFRDLNFQISNLKSARGMAGSGPQSTEHAEAERESGVGDARLWGTRGAQGRLSSARSGSGRRPVAVRRFCFPRTLSGRRAIVGFIIILFITVV